MFSELRSLDRWTFLAAARAANRNRGANLLVLLKKRGDQTREQSSTNFLLCERRNSTLKINYSKLGYDITAFIGIYLQKSALYEQVLEKLKGIPEITNIHYTTGNYSMFVKIHCKDTNHLKEVLHEKMQMVEGIERTETMISLEESLDRSLRLAE